MGVFARARGHHRGAECGQRSGGGVVPGGNHPLRPDSQCQHGHTGAGADRRGRLRFTGRGARAGRACAPPCHRIRERSGLMLVTLLAFVVTLGLLIVVHEYGHYRVAVACGVKVLRFSIGFGRVLWRRQAHPQATEFVVCALPLGGYVKMLDEREAPVAEPELGRAFNRKSLWQRAAIVVAGPAANLLLAIVLYAAANWLG